MRKVIITRLPLEYPEEQVKTVVARSRQLIQTICTYSKELRKKGVEVYSRDVNIIKTSDGWYMALWEDEVMKGRTKPPDELKPFKGIDGRMKVRILDKDGEYQIEDLAILVAKVHIPNPNDYEYVLFKDKNPENCKAENLFWSEIK